MRLHRRFVSWIACLGMVASLLGLVGCEEDDDPHDFGDNDPQLIVALGDSLTYGSGQSRAESYPAHWPP
jgi:hypothetical protein